MADDWQDIPEDEWKDISEDEWQDIPTQQVAMPTPTPIQATGSNNQDDWQDISEDEWQDIPQKQKIGVLESIWQGIGKGGLSFMEGLGGLGEMVGIENQLDDTARQAINRANQM